MRYWKHLHAALFLFVAGLAISPLRVVAQCDCGTDCTCADCPIKYKDRHGRWFVLETANFHVCCEHSEATATHLARHAEMLRNSLYSKWLGADAAVEWNPKCHIVLYSSKRNYVAAVGRGGERTVGSSLVKTDKGRIKSRRIDLLGDGTKFLSAALPHELTHVVLRDRFTSRFVPRWADEGMAILADSEAKQGRHQRDLQQALAQRTTFHAVELLTMNEYPSPSRFGAFYGQSASLTGYLVSRKSPKQFVEFLDRAREAGYDAALQECYDIGGVGELDRQWRERRYSVQSAVYGGAVKCAPNSVWAKPNVLVSASESSQPSGG
jgi:hypothetical protein